MSADGKSFTFKSIDYGDASYNVYARVQDFPRMARPRVASDNYAQADGVATQGSTFDDIRMVIDCAVTGTSVANVETLMSNVIGQLAKSQEGPGSLILDSHPTKQYTARLVSPVMGRLGLNGETFQLEFILTSPWASATTATTTSPAAISGSPTTI